MNLVLFDPDELEPPAGDDRQGDDRSLSGHGSPDGAGPLVGDGAPLDGDDLRAGNEATNEFETVTLPADDHRARHIVAVLGAAVGERLRCGVVGGGIAPFLLQENNAGAVTLRRAGPFAPPAGKPNVRVWLGHPRPIVLRRILRDLACLGIPEILVIDTELGEKSYRDSKLWKDGAYERYFREGMAQGGDTFMPRLERRHSVRDALARPGSMSTDCPGNTRLLLDLNAAITAAEVVLNAAEGGGGIVLAVGAERGFTAGERRLLVDASFLPCTLGPRTLRTEVAAVSGAVLCTSILDAVCERGRLRDSGEY